MENLKPRFAVISKYLCLGMFLFSGLTFVSAWDGNQVCISREAPCFIKACGPIVEGTTPSAAMIAIAQIQMGALAIRLGTTFTGSINTAVLCYPPIMEIFGLQDGYIPFSTFVIGYPAETYWCIPTQNR